MSLKNLMRILVIVSVLGWAEIAHASLLTDLVSYWNLDEVGGTRFDSVGSNDLTDNNTVTQATGILGNAAQFTSANSEWLSRPNNSSLETGDIDYTIALWAYFDDVSASDSIPIARDDGTVAGSEYRMKFDRGSRLLEFTVQGDTDVGEVNNASFGALSADTWYFVAAWHDAIANTVNLQINNSTIDSVAEPTGGPHIASVDFTIGRRLFGSTPFFFQNGRIDEVGFWKRTLTAGERTTLYEDPGALFREPSSGIDPIPEPSSLLLFGSGLLGFAGWGRKLFH